MRQQSAVVFAAAVAVLAAATSAQYPAGMGNWMRPEIEGLVASTEYDQHHVLYGQYDADAGNWTKLSFTAGGGDAGSPRVAVAEVFQNVDAPHKWELIKVRSLDARDAYYTAGFAEAALTHERIFDYYVNNVKSRMDKFLKVPATAKFFEKQLAHMEAYESDSEIGLQVKSLLRQLDGLWAGWEFAFKAAGSPAEMAHFDHKSMVYQSYVEDADNLAGELSDAQNGELKGSEMQKQQHRRRPTHCTVIQRLIDGELHVGHASLTNYVSMIRQVKTYEFPGGRNVTMSGYPGVISSIDDFIITGHDLQVTTTALLNFNNTNDGSVDATKLPGFIAMMVAAYQGTSAVKFADILSELIPGSYPAMVMITDTRKAYDAYTQNTTLPNGTFYVLEMIPHFAIYRDMTARLVADGHFLSFDIAYFPETRAWTLSGVPGTLKSDYYTTVYSSSAIAASDRRDVPYITNATTLFYAMRHNNYPHDPMMYNPRCRGVDPRYGDLSCDNITLVGPNANNTVSAVGAAPRYDLSYDSVHGTVRSLQGGIDAKVQSVSMIYEQQGSLIAQNGPTHVQQKPFSFSGFAKEFPPPKGAAVPPLRGLPDTFDFPPGVLNPHAGFAPKKTQASSGPSGGAPAGIAIAIGVVAVAAVVGAFVVVRQRRESRRVGGAGEGSSLL